METMKERVASHTAGEWLLVSSECGDGAPGESRHSIHADGRSEIAYLQSYTSPDGDDFGIGRDETEANGRLIAAAPDLLDACEFAVQWLDGSDAQVLRTAIDKARGKST